MGATWGINEMYFPADDFLGAKRMSAPNGAAPSGASGDVSTTHKVIVLGVLVVAGYALWHYSMTH